MVEEVLLHIASFKEATRKDNRGQGSSSLVEKLLLHVDKDYIVLAFI